MPDHAQIHWRQTCGYANRDLRIRQQRDGHRHLQESFRQETKVRIGLTFAYLAPSKRRRIDRLHPLGCGSYFGDLITRRAHFIESWPSTLLLAPAAIPTAIAAAWDGWLSRICKKRRLIAIGSISAKWTCHSATPINVMVCQVRKT